MIGIIIGIVVLIIAIIFMALTAIRWGRNDKDQLDVQGVRPLPILLGIGIAIAGFVGCSSVVQVGAGERGVVLEFGATTERTLDEGIAFVLPVRDSVQILPVQTLAFTANATAASSDLQDVATTVTLNYSLNPGSVNSIYQTLRRDWEPRIIVPGVQEAVKAATAEFSAENLIQQRSVAKARIEEILTARLLEHGMITENVSITDFTFSDVFTASIEAKVVAAQRALEAENDLERIKVEAQQAEAAAEGQRLAAIERAEGEKAAAILSAEGRAQAIELEAEAIASANEQVKQSLSGELGDTLIRFNTIEQLSDGIQTIILPPGQDFILGPEVLGR